MQPTTHEQPASSPVAPAPNETASFQPSDRCLVMCDGKLLHIFVQNEKATVIPMAGLLPIKRLGRTMVLTNRFAADVHITVDRDRLEESEAFERCLMSRMT